MKPKLLLVTKKSFIVFLLITYAIGCKKEYEDYNLFLYQEGGLSIVTVKMPKELRSSTKEFKHKISSVVPPIKISGKSRGNQKIDNWTYNFNDKSYNIDWNSFSHSTIPFSISYPMEWWVGEDFSRPFQALLDSTKRSLDERFIVISQNKDSISHNLISYFKLSLARMHKNNNNITQDHYRLVIEGDTIYHSTWQIRDSLSTKNFYNIFCERDNNIYDFSFIYNGKFDPKNYLIFFEMLSTCMINRKRLIDPYKHFQINEIDPVFTDL